MSNVKTYQKAIATRRAQGAAALKAQRFEEAREHFAMVGKLEEGLRKITKKRR